MEKVIVLRESNGNRWDKTGYAVGYDGYKVGNRIFWGDIYFFMLSLGISWILAM